jgi:hypothetical protein
VVKLVLEQLEKNPQDDSFENPAKVIKVKMSDETAQMIASLKTRSGMGYPEMTRIALGLLKHIQDGLKTGGRILLEKPPFGTNKVKEISFNFFSFAQ